MWIDAVHIHRILPHDIAIHTITYHSLPYPTTITFTFQYIALCCTTLQDIALRNVTYR